MRLEGLGRRSRRRLAGALLRGEPVELHLRRRPPEPELAQVLPLCAAVHVDGAPLRLAGGGAPEARPVGPDARPVTVIVPTHRRWPLGLGALLRQSHPLELRVLSNGAGPSWLPGARVEHVSWRGHGATRQAALATVDTPYVLFMSDDARPLGAGWLAALVAALESDSWDAVVARQVPWPDAPPAVRERVARWTPWSPAVEPLDQADHVATLHRTALLRAAPLPPVPIAEDLIWSRGRRIGLVAQAPVLHSHAPRLGAAFTRARAEHAVRAAHGLPTPGASTAGLLRGLAGLGPRALQVGGRVVAAELGELLGQWAGPRGVSGSPPRPVAAAIPKGAGTPSPHPARSPHPQPQRADDERDS